MELINRKQSEPFAFCDTHIAASSVTPYIFYSWWHHQPRNVGETDIFKLYVGIWSIKSRKMCGTTKWAYQQWILMEAEKHLIDIVSDHA